MDSSATNTANLQNTTYLPNQQVGEVTQATTTATQTTVDMTGASSSTPVEAPQAGQTQVEPTKTERFDTDTKNISPVYVQKYMSGINKSEDTGYRENENGDKFGFNNVMSNPNSIKNAFVLDFRRQQANSNSLKASNELFATLNNNDYKYGRQFIAGTWFNVRTPIDTEGKAIGLPEAIDNIGNPILDMGAKNIPYINYSKPTIV